jgi:hypothetical protein
MRKATPWLPHRLYVATLPVPRGAGGSGTTTPGGDSTCALADVAREFADAAAAPLLDFAAALSASRHWMIPAAPDRSTGTKHDAVRSTESATTNSVESPIERMGVPNESGLDVMVGIARGALLRYCQHDMAPSLSSTPRAHSVDAVVRTGNMAQVVRVTSGTVNDSSSTHPPPTPERAAVCFSGWLGVAVEGGGEQIRRNLLEPLAAEALLALTFNVATDRCTDEATCRVAVRFPNLRPVGAMALAQMLTLDQLVRRMERLPHWHRVLRAYDAGANVSDVSCKRNASWMAGGTVANPPYTCKNIYLGNTIFAPVCWQSLSLGGWCLDSCKRPLRCMSNKGTLPNEIFARSNSPGAWLGAPQCAEAAACPVASLKWRQHLTDGASLGCHARSLCIISQPKLRFRAVYTQDLSRCLDLAVKRESEVGISFTRLVHSRLELIWLMPHPPLRYICICYTSSTRTSTSC